MAVIDTYPTDWACDRHIQKPRTPQPRVVPKPLPHLTPKERYLLEWLASNAGKATLGKLPSKAGILAMVRLMGKGLIEVTIDMELAGWQAVNAHTAKEQVSSDRVARKAQIRRHEARLAART